MLYHLVYLWKYARRLQNKPTDLLIVSPQGRDALLREVMNLPLDRMMRFADSATLGPDFKLFNVKISTMELERR